MSLKEAGMLSLGRDRGGVVLEPAILRALVLQPQKKAVTWQYCHIPHHVIQWAAVYTETTKFAHHQASSRTADAASGKNTES